MVNKTLTNHIRNTQLLVKRLEQKRPLTMRHSCNVNKISCRIAQKLGVEDETELAYLRMGTLLHDLGKVDIPTSIIDKPGLLNNTEYCIIMKHTIFGHQQLRSFPIEVSQIALYHHERYDGQGYPYGLNGEQIPLLARICSVADVYDAMVSWRPYHKGKSLQEAIYELERGSGRQFDPFIVGIFINQLLDIECDQSIVPL